MKKCTDRRFEKMLHAYELGLLSDEDRAAFEIHQMECEFCYEQIAQFQDPMVLLEHDSDVRTSIKEMDEDYSSRTNAKAAVARRVWGIPLPRPAVTLRAFLVAAAALLILVLKPWHLEFEMHQEAMAEDNRLAIMSFADSAYSQQAGSLGEIIANLLITDLSDSRNFSVVSSQRLRDIVSLLRNERKDEISLYVVQAVADKTRAKWMLTGSTEQTDSTLILTTKLVETATDRVIATERMVADSNETVFTIVDSLAAMIRRDLSIPGVSREDLDKPVSEITTGSLEAYRYYLEGVDDYYKLYWKEAALCFDKAVELDSTFAMAYYYLARVQSPDYIEKAVEYSYRCTRKQQIYISSMKASADGHVAEAVAELERAVKLYPDEKDALLMLGEYMYALKRYDEAIRYLTAVIDIDPLNKRAYNTLAYAYDRTGNLEKSIWAISQYISIAPDEANPYDTRGEILANNGMVDQAIASYKRALEIKPDFQSSQMNLGLLCLLNGDTLTAKRCFEQLTAVNDAGLRSTGMLYLAYIPLYRGDYDAALRVIDSGIISDTNGPGISAIPNKLGLKAIIFREQGRWQEALVELEKAIKISRESWRDYEFLARDLRIQILAEQGEDEEAKQAADQLRIDLKEADHGEEPYWYALGSIQFAAGNFPEAIVSFGKSAVESNRFPLPSIYMVGRASLEAGDLGGAVEQFQNLQFQQADPRLYFGPWTVKSHYYLGLAYEKSEWTTKAVEQYTLFLKIWKDADPNIPEISDARMRLARLTS